MCRGLAASGICEVPPTHTVCPIRAHSGPHKPALSPLGWPAVAWALVRGCLGQAYSPRDTQADSTVACLVGQQRPCFSKGKPSAPI